MEATMPEPIQSEPEITEELLVIMSSAIAAYLGKNVRIRRARFISNQSMAAVSWAIDSLKR